MLNHSIPSLSPPQTNQRRFQVELPSVTAQLVILLPRHTSCEKHPPPPPERLSRLTLAPSPAPTRRTYMYKSFLFSHPRGKVERMSDRDPGVRVCVCARACVQRNAKVGSRGLHAARQNSWCSSPQARLRSARDRRLG